MNQINKIYKCPYCGNTVEIVSKGFRALTCCNRQMIQLKENDKEASQEKHIPIKEISEDKIKITVGSVIHPMEKEHYIEWIEILTDSEVYRKHLEPGEDPKAEFLIDTSQNIAIRAYCNVHGLWKA